jgi:very-short-patch-repair endonuclease
MEKDWSALDARARGVLEANGGVAHVSAFDAAGVSRQQLGALRGRGVIERPRIGWYVDPSLPWQVKVATRVGGPAACITAAELHGLPVPPRTGRDVHVHAGAHTGRVRHNRDKTRVLASVDDDGEVRLHRAPLRQTPRSGRTGLLDTFLMLVGCVSAEWFVAALDAALHRPRQGSPLMDAETFTMLRALVPEALIRLVDPLAESPLETLLRLGLLARGITDFVAQAVPHPAYRVDFLVRGRLVVEADGAAFHDPVADAIRDARLQALGYRVLRFPYERIVFDLEAVLDEIEAQLADLRPREVHG